ncbi:MAG: hypothetical protein KatS3mg114_0995 [Planctomycetaceae bacterium]|nr:MAG: hypothetical protein KatS3mg114_0995 [Planctomycetaceae bacterium]
MTVVARCPMSRREVRLMSRLGRQALSTQLGRVDSPLSDRNFRMDR